VLVPLYEYRMQRPVEILARTDTRDVQRLEGVKDGTRSDRHPGGAQRTCEVHNVFGKTSLRRGHDITPPP
jgi:hypothetical protein